VPKQKADAPIYDFPLGDQTLVMCEDVLQDEPKTFYTLFRHLEKEHNFIKLQVAYMGELRRELVGNREKITMEKEKDMQFKCDAVDVSSSNKANSLSYRNVFALNPDMSGKVCNSVHFTNCIKMRFTKVGETLKPRKVYVINTKELRIPPGAVVKVSRQYAHAKTDR